jgi:hypothetical protein
VTAVYVGAHPADSVAAGQLYAVTFRNTFNVSLAFWRPWSTEVRQFVDKIPGSNYAFAVGDPAVDDSSEVAVVVLRVASLVAAGVGGGVSLGEWTRKVAEYFPGTAVTRVARVGGEVIGAGDQELRLEAAAEEAARERFSFQRLAGDALAGLRKVGIVALLVAGVVLFFYLVARGNIKLGAARV